MTPNPVVLTDWRDQIDPAHTAIVLVDLQNDFIHPDGWVARQQVPGFHGDTGITDAVDRASILLDAARDSGALVVFVRMIGDDRYLSGPMKALYGRNHGHDRGVCVAEGTWGADVADVVAPASRDEIIIDKHRYSAFIGTRLEQVLRSHGILTIVVCGVATSGCVESTARDGFMSDLYTVIAADACADYEPARHRASLSKLALSFGEVRTTAEIAAEWRRRA